MDLTELLRRQLKELQRRYVALASQVAEERMKRVQVEAALETFRMSNNGQNIESRSHFNTQLFLHTVIAFADELKLAGMQQYDEEEYRYESDMNQKIQEQQQLYQRDENMQPEQQHLIAREQGERLPRGESRVASTEMADARDFLEAQLRAQRKAEEQAAFLRAQNDQQQQQLPQLKNPSSSPAVTPGPASMSLSVSNLASPSVSAASVLTAAGTASAFTSVSAQSPETPIVSTPITGAATPDTVMQMSTTKDPCMDLEKELVQLLNSKGARACVNLESLHTLYAERYSHSLSDILKRCGFETLRDFVVYQKFTGREVKLRLNEKTTPSSSTNPVIFVSLVPAGSVDPAASPVPPSSTAATSSSVEPDSVGFSAPKVIQMDVDASARDNKGSNRTVNESAHRNGSGKASDIVESRDNAGEIRNARQNGERGHERNGDTQGGGSGEDTGSRLANAEVCWFFNFKQCQSGDKCPQRHVCFACNAPSHSINSCLLTLHQAKKNQHTYSSTNGAASSSYNAGISAGSDENTNKTRPDIYSSAHRGPGLPFTMNGQRVLPPPPPPPRIHSVNGSGNST